MLITSAFPLIENEPGDKKRFCYRIVSVLLSCLAFCYLMQANSGSWFDHRERMFYPVDRLLNQPTLTVRHEIIGDALLLYLDAEDFNFSTTCNNIRSSTLLGHAHIYVDGIKKATAYEPVAWIDIDQPGSHKITITLNALPHHRFLSYKGEPIQQVFNVNMPALEIKG